MPMGSGEAWLGTYKMSIFWLSIFWMIVLFRLGREYNTWFLVGIFLFFIDPRVLRISYFAAIISGLFLIYKWNKKLLSVILSFIRPEFFISFLLTKWRLKDWWVFLVAGGLLFLFGFPGNKLELAVRSHYAFTYSIFFPFENPWYEWMKLPFNWSYLLTVGLYSLIAVPLGYLCYLKVDRQYWAFCLPILLSVMFIFPRPHYIFMLLPFLLYKDIKCLNG